MPHIHFDRVVDFIGFSLDFGKAGDSVRVLTKAAITSDDPNFYTYIGKISSEYFNAKDVMVDSVYNFLILIHEDLSADVYFNSPIVCEIRTKRSINKGENITQNDIADIISLQFSGVEAEATDKVVCCFKEGWKFGLLFDLDRKQLLDINEMTSALGMLYRRLSFQYVYDIVQSAPKFNEMIQDGWFPFIEIIGQEYKIISDIYDNKYDFENRINKLAGVFSADRMKNLSTKWWKSQVFKDKQEIIETGINAYLRDDPISCIKIISSEIEGIIRINYYNETGKGKNIKFSDLIDHILEKGRSRSGCDDSLFLPSYFSEYMKKIMFADFNLETGKIDLSRHTSCHGVARPETYTKVRALQMILVLDQIYFYMGNSSL